MPPPAPSLRFVLPQVESCGNETSRSSGRGLPDRLELGSASHSACGARLNTAGREGCAGRRGEPNVDARDPIIETVLSMTEAFHRGDIPAILRTYEPGAVVVGEPGRPLSGEAALGAMFAGFIALEPAFTYSGHDVVQAGDIALHLAPWRMTGTAADGTMVQARGLSVAVLRRQPDGRWLMAIDQPYGDGLLRAAEAGATSAERGGAS